ncbi:MAG: hypothetical protein VKL60_15620 [Sphaerospermopsis sp.]|jgi:hypothetical protein|uniref:Uncharacterized protein n=1 Tax=Sphaerospermopsis aphanizomenoides LEGE 00250 TaxID=2777972 RepID=A0ABR9VFN9_9CYAN|nr:hypothetical protein [Sphaerospermopsis aphanizomenoides]MBE9237311.1 hypothetical protein [Sphaerospermopsis aphanizomenoides LEGE 00250]MEB3150427.1 hypothetical protein [Sphaerospermopsis sp.]
MNSHNAKPELTTTVNSTSEELKNTSLIKKLCLKYPWLWFVGLLVIPLGVGIFGYFQLIYIGYVPKIEPEKPIEVVSKKENVLSSNINNPTPLWLMLAIALSCASGCWVIYRILKLPQRI